MLETVDLKAKLDKETYTQAQQALDIRLGELQRALRAKNIPVFVVFEGWTASGKGSTLSRILLPLDARGYKVHYIAPPNQNELLFPPMRRFWIILPNDGILGFFSHSWYRQVDEPVKGEDAIQAQRNAYERIRVFERQLTDDGAVIVKFFLHISKKEQAKRFKQLADDPAYSWKIGKAERKAHKKYDTYLNVYEDMLRETSTPYAPWTIVPATDDRMRNVTVAETLTNAFEKALADHQPEISLQPPQAPRRTSPFDRVNLSKSIERNEYDVRMPQLQQELRRLQHVCYTERRPVILAFEGWDAAGKGGNIRRIVRELDPRGYEVIPIAAPDGPEKVHQHLWRFWRALPKAGHLAIFDRTWYGRVLVERLEQYATPTEWNRAYREINEFEQELTDYGAILFKFWLHISKEEQLKRFEARQQDAAKQWKITDEDWRNREKWDDYWNAVSDMIERTSTIQAPWTIIEGNDKLHARVQTLDVITAKLNKELGS